MGLKPKPRELLAASRKEFKTPARQEVKVEKHVLLSRGNKQEKPVHRWGSRLSSREDRETLSIPRG